MRQFEFLIYKNIILMAYGAIGEEQEEYQGQLHQNWLFFIRFQ